MLNILVASFVVVCSLMVIAASLYVLRSERRNRALSDEIILAAEPLRPEWIYGRRMDMPQKWPALRTRNAKVLR